MKTIELDEDELALLSAIFSSTGINIPIAAAPVVVRLQGKLFGVTGPKLVKGE